MVISLHIWESCTISNTMIKSEEGEATAPQTIELLINEPVIVCCENKACLHHNLLSLIDDFWSRSRTRHAESVLVQSRAYMQMIAVI